MFNKQRDIPPLWGNVWDNKFPDWAFGIAVRLVAV
jgi:hypothetical protein